MIDVSEEQLWDDYSHWHAQTGNYQQRKKKNEYLCPLKATPERLALMHEMKVWCVERNFAPRQWLFTLFAVRRWIFAPHLRRGDLCSEKHIARYKKWRNYDRYTQRLRDLEATKPVGMLGTQFDPNRDINHTSELAKKSYLSRGLESECIANMHTETFGFHPRSEICSICTRKTECEAALVASVNFDILALRRGEITSEDAYRSALQAKVYGR